MRTTSSRPLAMLLTAVLAVATLTVTAAVSRADVVAVVEHNASIVVNGWNLKGDVVTRRSDGVVKVVGNAQASHDGHRCAGTAEKIVLNTSAERISFIGGAKVDYDHVTHVGGRGSAGLAFDYRHHTISAISE